MAGKLHHVLVLTYWPYADALIQTYTLPYIHIFQKYLPAGSRVYLVTLENIRHSKEKIDQISSVLSSENIHWVPIKYNRFGVKMLFRWVGQFGRLKWLIFRKKIRTIHAWCTPAGGLGWMLSVVTRRRLVLDSFEPHAEPMLESGTWKPGSFAFRLLFWLERKQARRAWAVIACVEKMQEYAKEKYGIVHEKFYVKPACVDLQKFDLGLKKQKALIEKTGLENKLVGFYSGKFGGSYFGKEIISFFAFCAAYWGEKFAALILTNHDQHKLEDWRKEAGLPKEQMISMFVDPVDIPKYTGLADFAITPFIPVPSKRFGTPIKTGEYWAMGLPVVITPGISDDSEIIEKEQIGAVVKDFTDEAEVIDALKKIDQLLAGDRRILQERIRAVAQKYRNFEIAERVYQEVYGNK